MEAKQNELSKAVADMMSKVTGRMLVFSLHTITITIMLLQIEVEKLRPLQRNMYLKLAECYNSKTASSNEIQNCEHRHSAPMQVVQQVMQHEMGQLQDRLQRCSMACQDEVRDKYPNVSGPNPAADAMAERCLINCADKHIAMLKSIKYNIDTKIDEVAKR